MRDVGLYRALMRYTESLRASVEFDTAVVYMLTDVGGEARLLPEVVLGIEFQVYAGLALPLGEGVSGLAATSGTAIVNKNPAEETREPLDTHMMSALAMPLNYEGRLVGVLTLYHLDYEAFSKSDLAVVYPMAWEIACLLANHRAAQDADVHALVDYPTGLSNARAFLQHLDAEIARAQRGKFSIAVLSCRLRGGEIDVNRARKAAARLREVVRPYDTVARMGEAEFMILMPEIDGGSVERRIRFLSMELSDFPFIIGSAIYEADAADADSLAAMASQRSQTFQMQALQ